MTLVATWKYFLNSQTIILKANSLNINKNNLNLTNQYKITNMLMHQHENAFKMYLNEIILV